MEKEIKEELTAQRKLYLEMAAQDLKDGLYLTAQKELEHASWLAEVINTSEKKEGFIG